MNTDNLVLQGNISEQIRHRFSMVNASNRLCQEKADVDGLDLAITAVIVCFMEYRVGHNNLHNKWKSKVTPSHVCVCDTHFVVTSVIGD